MKGDVTFRISVSMRRVNRLPQTANQEWYPRTQGFRALTLVDRGIVLAADFVRRP